ncbi:MAG: pyruvate ferredoxin oxidoreductase [Thermofilum sp. ex4484_15]|nr:MAG: pyruvate ferredoxin oxidoreductase [Thermofilum sp. ex4484_15]
MKLLLTSNYAAAYGAKLARVEIVAAYPITPQTQVVEKLAEFIEGEELKATMIRVESEHSAMAACIGAAAAGARPFTATSSQGLLYMYEMIWWAAGARLPIVMGVVTRAIAPPWSIWSDHADILSIRDSGWIIIFSESAQEVLDNIIQAYRIAEHKEVLLPVAVGWDAFTSSHTAEPVSLPEQELVDSFLPPRTPEPFVLDVNEPISHGNLTYPDEYMEFRFLINEGLERARKVIREVGKEYGKLTGREYGLIEEYKCGDADVILVTLGSMAGDVKDAVDILRKEGYHAGLVKLRCLRPFPREALLNALREARAVGIVERSFSMGRGGIIATEINSLLRESGVNDVVTVSYIAGLGGREIGVNDFINIFKSLFKKMERGSGFEVVWYGLRG